MKKITITLYFICLLTAASKGITFGGAGNDHGFEAVRTSDRGYVLVGQYDSSGADIYVVKLDSLVHLEWTKTIGLPGQDEYANSIVQTNDGGFLIMGTHFDLSGNLRAWLLRLNSSGDTLWTHTYVDPSPAAEMGTYVEVYNANEYTIGINYDAITTTFLFLCRTDTLGNITDTISTSPIYGSVLPVLNGYLMTATVNPFAPSINLYRVDTVAGTYSFDKSYFDPNFTKNLFAKESATCGSGFLTVGGTNLYTAAPNDREFYLMRTDSIGDSLWTKHWGSGISELDYILRDNYSQYFVAGNTNASGLTQVFIWKTDSLGDTLWTKFIGNNLSISSITLADSGGFILVGDSTDSLTGKSDAWMSLYDSLGNPVINPSTGFANYLIQDDVTINTYPNPAGDHIYIDFVSDNIYRSGYFIRIDDSIGKTIYSGKITQRIQKIEIQSWPEGIYYLNVFKNNGKKIGMKKIVKD